MPGSASGTSISVVIVTCISCPWIARGGCLMRAGHLGGQQRRRDTGSVSRLPFFTKARLLGNYSEAELERWVQCLLDAIHAASDNRHLGAGAGGQGGNVLGQAFWTSLMAASRLVLSASVSCLAISH